MLKNFSRLWIHK